MQSQYGVPEIQQFMADGGCSPVFSIGTADMQGTSQAQKQQQHHLHHHHGHHLQHLQHQQQSQRALHHHQHLHLHHHHLPQMQLQQPVALPPPQAFQHFHPIPVTQQLFQHGPQFQLFQQEQQRRIHQQLVHLGLEIESGPENSSSPTRNIIPAAAAAAAGAGGGGIPPFLGGAGFKLTVNESGGGGDGDSRDRLNDDEGILQGDEGSETHIQLWNAAREEEPGIKEPFWRPLDVDCINRNNKRCKEKQPEPSHSGGKHCKSTREGDNVDDSNNSASNYKLFSELEAIYKPVGGGGGGGDGSGSSSRAGLNNNQQTGSGSALTGENPQAMAAEPRDADWGHNAEGADQGSDTSTGEEAAQIDKPNKSSGGSSSGRRKRKRKQQLSSIAAFFESLVKRLMEHQEGLHHKFLEVLDRRDQERINREELWRQQEAAKGSREATARAQEQALASTREAAIISFLEKITGESLSLPTREQFQSQLPEESSQKEGPKHGDLQPDSCAVAPVDGSDADVNHTAGHADPGIVNPSRWPKAEVQALIRVRSSLESRFQEPGLKGPLWEEVSATLAAMGYQRSAKRCKEKWENINKYFRKTKDSPKKRSQHSKTCPYFHQLDQLYSKSLSKAATPQAGTAATPSTTVGRRDSSELLDAVVVPSEQAPSCFRFPDVDAARLESGSRGDDDNHEASGSATTGRRDGEDGEDEEGDEEEEGEGDSQEQAARSSRGHDDRPDQHDRTPRDAAVFFRRLET